MWAKEALKQGHKCPEQLQPGIPRKSDSRWHRLHLAVWGAGWRAGLDGRGPYWVSIVLQAVPTADQLPQVETLPVAHTGPLALLSEGQTEAQKGRTCHGPHSWAVSYVGSKP